MKTRFFTLPTGMIKTLSVAVALALGSSLTVDAQDVVYVTTYDGSAQNTSCIDFCNNPLGLEQSFSGFGSTDISAAPGVPSRTKCVYYYGGTPNWNVIPQLNVPGAVYRIDVAHNTSPAITSCTAEATVTAYSEDGTVSASCTNSPVFQRAYSGPVWNTMGYITNNPGITAPTITMYYTGGDLTGVSTLRLYVDAFKFTEISSCEGVAGDVVVTGPLVADQTFVNVIGITEGATNVTIYVSDAEIGQTNYAAGFAAGSLTVPVNMPLYKDAEIKARQSKDGCTSPMPSSGPLVGGGANPPLRISLGLLQNDALTGPAGANATASGTLYWLKASGLVSGSGTAPLGGATLTPGECWQTVTFSWQGDTGLNWINGLAVEDANPYAALESLVFAIDVDEWTQTADSGPYDIYVDEIKNGDTVIENFEGYAAGSEVTLRAPNVPTQYPNPLTTYVGAPNATAISQNYAYEGTNSSRIQWQFKDTQNVRWARVVAGGAAAGRNYPQLDTSKPVTLKVLVLPVGETTARMFNGSVSEITNAAHAYTGQTKTIGVTVTGSGNYTYQWSWSGGDLYNSTTEASYTIDGFGAGMSATDSGTYTVEISDGICTEVRSCVINVVDADPSQVVITATQLDATHLQLSWEPDLFNFDLVWDTNVSGSYNNVIPNVTSPYTVTIGSEPTKFFRLRAQQP